MKFKKVPSIFFTIIENFSMNWKVKYRHYIAFLVMITASCSERDHLLQRACAPIVFLVYSSQTFLCQT